jgi:3-oxoacyl-[acyl-carrier-protein] synthase-3
MAFLSAFGRYLPSRIVSNEEIGARVGVDASWIMNVSGIAERRFAGPDESVVDLAVQAGKASLEAASLSAADLGMIIVASGTAERRFPGPAVEVSHRLGAACVPAIDLPMASAGSLFALSLATRLAGVHQRILVIGAEKMSAVVEREPMERGVAILFGDGAGSCIVSAEPLPQAAPVARILACEMHSDGAFAGDLKLEFAQSLEMNGRTVILQASRKVPAAIQTVLDRYGRAAASVAVYLMHQANQNLIDKIAQTLGVDSGRFFSNIRHYGNTSSASMLIAAADWFSANRLPPGQTAVFAAFGAGFHWGAALAEGV